MTTAWSHLANAAHIDRIIANVKANHDSWVVAYHATRLTGYRAAYDAACSAAWAAEAAVAAAAAVYTVAALAAWDHAGALLDMTPQALTMWYHISDDPAAVLLIPAVTALQHEIME